MSKIILVTGGARSGKSNFAESLCINQNNRTAYIATSVAFDEEMKNRVMKHQESRPKEWKTYEIYKDIYSIVETLDKNHDTVIMDCVTLIVNNLKTNISKIPNIIKNIKKNNKIEKYNLFDLYKLIRNVIP